MIDNNNNFSLINKCSVFKGFKFTSLNLTQINQNIVKMLIHLEKYKNAGQGKYTKGLGQL